MSLDLYIGRDRGEGYPRPRRARSRRRPASGLRSSRRYAWSHHPIGPGLATDRQPSIDGATSRLSSRLISPLTPGVGIALVRPDTAPPYHHPAAGQTRTKKRLDRIKHDLKADLPDVVVSARPDRAESWKFGTFDEIKVK